MDLIKEGGPVVDSRACRAGERFVPYAAVQFPCHVAWLGVGVIPQILVGEQPRSHSFFQFLPHLDQRDLLSPGSLGEDAGGDGGESRGEVAEVRGGRRSQACAATASIDAN